MEIIERMNKAYLVSYPRHCLYEFDLETRGTRLVGRIGTRGGSDIFKDTRDRIYGSYDGGQLYRYLPEEDEFAGTLFHSLFSLGSAYAQRQRCSGPTMLHFVAKRGTLRSTSE